MTSDRLAQQRAAVEKAREILDPDVPEDARYLAELESALEFNERNALRDFEPRGQGN